jgi:hypothetical protein
VNKRAGARDEAAEMRSMLPGDAVEQVAEMMVGRAWKAKASKRRPYHPVLDPETWAVLSPRSRRLRAS